MGGFLILIELKLEETVEAHNETVTFIQLYEVMKCFNDNLSPLLQTYAQKDSY